MPHDPTGPRNEEERRDRQMLELLNELRVALPGVQILFAFLLAVPFTSGWDDVTKFQRDVFFATLMATAVATAFLIAPSSAHRIRFHKGDREWLVERANRLFLAGLVSLFAALVGVVQLITDDVYEGAVVWIATGAITVLIALLWFLRPLARHAEQDD